VCILNIIISCEVLSVVRLNNRHEFITFYTEVGFRVFSLFWVARKPWSFSLGLHASVSVPFGISALDYKQVSLLEFSVH